MEDLGSDRWQYDSKAQCIVGQRTGRNIRLGQAVKVRIISVNVPARQLDIAPTEPFADASRPKKESKTQKKKSKRAKRGARSKRKK
jgi:ribonuclease R